MSTKKNEFLYFKVPDLLLDTDIKKSELWVYLTHCRHRGSRSKGYSIAGINKVREHFGNSISKKVYDNCIESLIKKELIEVVDPKEEKIYTGFYKTGEAIHITKGKNNIQIPIELLDKKIITNLNVEEIKDIIKLYSLYDPMGSYGSLNHEIINVINKTTKNGAEYIFIFGSGYNRIIHKKKAYKIEPPTHFITDLDIDLNKYMKLFKLKPVILEFDTDDEDIKELKGEVFPDLLNNKKHKYITVLKDNQKVVWVLEPVYPVKNTIYDEYLNFREEARARAKNIYSDTDYSTDEDTIKKLIYGEDLLYFINESLEDRKDIEVDKILERLNYIKDNNYNADTIEEDLKFQIDLISYEIKKEKESIEQHNIKILEETGKRRRHTTNTRLKDLEYNIYELEKEIENIENIENKLIELIPKWIIDKLLIEY